MLSLYTKSYGPLKQSQTVRFRTPHSARRIDVLHTRLPAVMRATSDVNSVTFRSLALVFSPRCRLCVPKISHDEGRERPQRHGRYAAKASRLRGDAKEGFREQYESRDGGVADLETKASREPACHGHTMPMAIGHFMTCADGQRGPPSESNFTNLTCPIVPGMSLTNSPKKQMRTRLNG